MIGQFVSHYRILSKIGQGGMGEVYLAEDTEIQRRVALKFIPASAATGPDAIERLRREARAAGSLDHPAIVTIYEIGSHEGRPFIAMAYVEGESLRTHLERHAIPVERALEIVGELCNGLAKAHAAGIVHRDLKPDNIMLDAAGRVRILDFGLAKLADLPTLTETNSTVGTLHYMSPEQVRGETVDRRSDLFSIGSLLYEMLAGRKAFDGPHAAAVQYAIVNEEPEPVTRYNPRVSPEAARIVGKLLDKNPSRRYQSAEDLGADLRRLTGARLAGSRPPGKARARSLQVGIPVAVAVIAAAAALLFGPARRGGGPVPVEARPVIAVLPFENLGAADDSYFADGITEEITSRLAMVHGIGVISRTSTQQYRASTKPLGQIAQELGANYILEGTVRWDRTGGGKRVRITPQLIRTSDDTHVWASNYEHQLDRIFEVQADIASNIVRAMELTLLDRDRDALAVVPTSNVEAYNVYLRGREHDSRGYELDDVQQAIVLYERAVQLDSTFAAAWARLGMAHANMYQQGYDRTDERLRRAKRAVDRAFALAPNSPDANLAMAYYRYWGFKDYAGALESAARAEQIQPGGADIHKTIGLILRRQGRHEEAVARFEQALRLDPRSTLLLMSLAETYGSLGKFRTADTWYQRVIEETPESSFGYMYLAGHRLVSPGGGPESALAVLDRAPPGPVVWLTRFRVLYYQRDYDAALDALDRCGLKAHVFEGAFWPKSLLAAFVRHSMGDHASAAALADSARVMLEAVRVRNEDDVRIILSLAICAALRGEKDEAMRLGRLALDISSYDRDRQMGGFFNFQFIQVCLLVGERDTAFDEIRRLPATVLLPTVLRMDPAFDPLRGDPRFEAEIKAREAEFARLNS